MIRKTYKYRLYPTDKQVALLSEQLAEACRLYNAALQERRDAWRINRERVSYYTQANQLKEIRASGDLALANCQTCQDVLMRVDRALVGFFNRVKRGEKAGFPRFRSYTRFDSYTFPTYGNGCKLLACGKLRLQGVGTVKVKLHRSVVGKIKTVTVKREGARWYVCFVAECEPSVLPSCTQSVGVDVGISAFATLSNGLKIENPRHYNASQARLRRAQRKVSRRKKGSSSRRKAVQLLRRINAHIKNQRADFHHKVSRRLVNNFGFIVVEDLNVQGMASGMLAKPVNDAGWSAFITKLAYKAAEAGRELMRVDPRGTSQRCVCGASVPKTLKQRWHECTSCGLSVDRDHASALEILRLGLSLSDLTYSVTSSVSEEAICLS